jgi:hypothetical protein
MEQLKVVNSFRFTSNKDNPYGVSKSPDSEIRDTIKQMEKLALAYNFSQEIVTLHFFGDTKSDLRFRVECNDAETQMRITNALKLYQKNH